VVGGRNIVGQATGGVTRAACRAAQALEWARLRIPPPVRTLSRAGGRRPGRPAVHRVAFRAPGTRQGRPPGLVRAACAAHLSCGWV